MKISKKPLFEDWVFDLDNTLYPASSSLFPQIEDRMRLYITELLQIEESEAQRLQKDYYRQYGTTLAGLMAVHKVVPEDFLAYVHEIDCTVLPAQPRLVEAIAKIPGRKLVFTNGSERHAENVLRQLGLTDQFSAIFDIKAANFVPKPQKEAYESFVKQFGVKPDRAVMFEDLTRNLAAPAQMGMTTVWVKEDGHSFAGEPEAADNPDVHHVTDDLAGWINNILK